MLWVKRLTFLLSLCLLIGAQGPGPGPGRKRSPTVAMQSRAVDTRISLEVAEGLPSGTVVGSIPIKSNFTYRFNEPPNEFSLDANTGIIRTTMVLDRESFRSDRFDLVVLSSQPTYPIEVRIVVTDTNDNAPEFPEPSITVMFSESSAPGTRLLLDSAFDRDSGVNGVLTYAIVAGNKDQKFRINVTSNPSGEMSYLHLETTGNLDRETRAFYNLNISARDGGDPPLYGYLQVNVTILDVNDNPPMFDHSDYNVSLNESVPPGTSVLQVRATDNDIGDNAKVTYNLEDIGRQFAIDSETGVISTTEPLVCVRQQNCSELSLSQGGCPKSCVISVSAWDHGSPRQVGRAYVTVNLIEVNTNDHDPIINFTYFLRPAKFATVDENAANGSVVAAVTVVDLDEGLNGETTVVIKSGNELNHFRLDSTPAVRVNGVLDREEISKYNLTIVATDKGTPPRSSSASLIIYVNDVNDHEPVFEKSEYSVVLSELSPPGTYVAGITATDEDSGVNAQIYYAFVSGNERNWFAINTDSGLITTRTFVDREVQGSVELKISARDGGPNPKWAYTQLKVTILDENDGKPKFFQDQINATLSEDIPPNTLVATLTASDSDQGTNGSVAYFLDTELQPELLNLFALDSLTGQLTTKVMLDREITPEYKIRVIAKDQGLPPQSSTALVHVFVEDVNDNSPEFYPLKYFAPIPEDVSVGTSVLQVFAHDIDEGKNAELRYAIESGQEGLFEINSKTGVISIASPLKYSKKTLFEIVVTVRDLEGRKCPENAVVEIIKDNHVQQIEFDVYGGYSFKVTEDEANTTPAIGSKLGRIHIRSGDAQEINGDDIRYYIIEGDEGKTFAMNDRTGIISRIKAIDREEKAFYSLKCIARANLAYGWTLVNITVIDINDNRPTFAREKEEVHVDENAPVGLEIYHAKAKDKDAGPNNRFKYTLTANPENRFRINELTGVVYLNRKIQKPPGTRIPIEITVTDFGEPPLTSKQVVTLNVRDVNDHTPVFDHTSYETSLLESTPVNDRFFRLSATDADLSANGMVTYAITEGNTEGNFGIFPDGYLYVKSTLDREDKDYYSLIVTARDGGDPPRSSTVPVVIHVIDENDNRPEFTNSTFTFHIFENEPPDSFVGKLTAVDSDLGRNAELTFSFSGSQKEFVVDSKNGFVKTLIVFDKEELTEKTGRSFISLEAVVNDNGQNRLKDKATVNVYIDDVNDNPPVFVKAPYKVHISEGSTKDTQVIRVHASDADEGINGDVYYSITAGNEEGKFSIEPGTGQITLLTELDRESTPRYLLTVTAEDGALHNRLSVSTTVVIDVLDENDNAPEFAQTESKISVPETTPVNTKLSQFRATDRDLGINSEIVFSIGAGNRRETFHVDPNSGALYLHKPLDYEELNMYTLTIVASDGGNPRLSSSILFNVTVEDRNDNPPAFPNTALVRQILEGIPVNKAIVTVVAEDPDSGNNGKVMYSIASQEPEMPNHEKHFGINPVTGVIYTLLPIDREAVDTFLLTVVATDQAQPESNRLSSEKLVTVIVEDINDNAPVFVSMKAAVLPKEGVHVMNVYARDLDSNTNGLVTYDLVSGDVELFKLDINTGALTLRQPLRNPRSRYHIGVKATDEAVQTERKATEAYITLFATNEENAGPKFEQEGLRGSVNENEPPGKSILTVYAKVTNVDVEYFVTNVTGNGKQVDCLFDVDSKTGVLSNAVALDREKGSEFYIVEIYAVGVNTTKPYTAKTKVYGTSVLGTQNNQILRDGKCD
ncbi:hypothetical protein RUM43_009876 [Polyplax serrata]|uniref:Cadherin domain-containing protein n=1 Tax=Polyplax serrata TaxID=468196 RepID=A0AAN8P3D7_POLSC